MILRRAVPAAALGIVTALGSTFVGERWVTAAYPDIMGCEEGCRVVATGWPLVFIRDYPGMSVVHTADLLEVLIAADRFAWLPFCLDAIFWALLAFLLLHALRRRPSRRAEMARGQGRKRKHRR